jgi:hypothetical protein
LVAVLLVLLVVGGVAALVAVGVVRLLDGPGMRNLRSGLAAERRPAAVDEDVAQ